jgi:tetraacyldisaccharide 4'-kinase
MNSERAFKTPAFLFVFQMMTFETRVRCLINKCIFSLWNTPFSPSSLNPLFFPLALGSKIYKQGLKYHQQKANQNKQHLPAFVISVGNLVVGGTGKTPLTLWLARYLENRGWLPAILSRGYGKKSNQTGRVPLQGDTRSQVLHFGDEPVLMARNLTSIPVWVGQKRWLTGQAAIRCCGSQILLLDDGFQHLSLHRDMDLVLLDVQNPFGNGKLLPLGPLREPIEHLERANAVILTRSENRERDQAIRSMLREQFPRKPIFSCRHRLGGFRVGLNGPAVPLLTLQDHPVVAFAGIAQPEDFFCSLERQGILLSRRFAFPDHHFYRNTEVKRLVKSVRESESRFLITTEKDLVRLPQEIQDTVLSATLEVDFGSEREVFCNYLEKQLCSL